MPLQRLLARIGRWPGLRWVEGWVRSLPPWGAVCLFALPTALLLPVKLLALWAMGHGHVVLGVTVIALAKVVGTAVVARLFTLTQPALIVHDHDDTDVPEADARAIAAAWPAARLVITQGLGHRGVLRSSEVVHHVLEFLRT